MYIRLLSPNFVQNNNNALMKSDARQLKVQIKTKEDVKRFFQKMMNDKRTCIEYMCERRPLSELKSSGIKVAKISEVLG